jgi:hypothetical protein
MMPCSQSVSLLLPTSQRNPDFSSMAVGLPVMHLAGTWHAAGCWHFAFIAVFPLFALGQELLERSDDPFEPLGPLEFLGIRVEHPVRFLHVRDGASPSALALPFHRRILLCP